LPPAAIGVQVRMVGSVGELQHWIAVAPLVLASHVT